LGWEKQTPLDAARRSEETDLVGWLRSRDARTAEELD
jgi:hypothetical protein